MNKQLISAVRKSSNESDPWYKLYECIIKDLDTGVQYTSLLSKAEYLEFVFKSKIGKSLHNFLDELLLAVREE